ncbi:MAG TPA: hypothetical protein VL137_00340 [Polyangiaceae bacterium]|nr:hypothetical protein [Polyangiaceae bacterium]
MRYERAQRSCYSAAVVFAERSFYPASLSVAYVCAAAWQSGGTATNRVLAPWALVALPLAVFFVWKLSVRTGTQTGDATDTMRRCVRVAGWGALLWFAAHLAPAGRPSFEAIANIGAASAVVSACVCLARIPAVGGLMRPTPSAQSLDAAVFCTLIWSIAVAVPLARVSFTGPGVWLDPLAIDYTTTTASVASLFVLIASAWRIRIIRKLELGIADRAAGALAIATAALAIGVPAAAANIAAPDRTLPLAALLASLSVIATARTNEPSSVARVLRITVTVMMLGVPAALIAAGLANAMPRDAALIVLVSSLFCVGVGLLAQLVSRPLGPQGSRWLTALQAASKGALEPEPEAALRATLRALENANPDPTARCEIWCKDPDYSLSVNIAGNLQTGDGQAPARLYELANSEPLNTLRTEVLQALEVRKPEIRPLLAWLQMRKALCVTVINDDDGPLGLLLIPKGRRRATMTIEEVEALHAITHRLSALIAISAALARSARREAAARDHAAKLEVRNAQLAQGVNYRAQSNLAFAQMLARPIQTGLYSAAARALASQVEHASKLGTPVLMQAPAGVDAVGWVAWGHSKGPRCSGPLIVVDATTCSSAELGLQQGQAEPGAWSQAQAGTLVILNAHALKETDLQDLARTLATLGRGPASEPPSPALVLVSSSPPHPDFMRWLALDPARAGIEQVVLPALIDRSADLQALILEQLARLGPGADGDPLGIEPGALQVLLEYTWPGNDAELKGVLARAASQCQGPRISAEDLKELAEAPPPSERKAALGQDYGGALTFASAARRRHSPRK